MRLWRAANGSLTGRLGARILPIAVVVFLFALGLAAPASAVTTCATTTAGADVTVALAIGVDDRPRGALPFGAARPG
jgi:hypothetical protein